MPREDERRPAGNRAADAVSATSFDKARVRAVERSADLAMRCAWLRVHADELYDVDPSGQLSAQLADFADLLEVAQREGWFK